MNTNTEEIVETISPELSGHGFNAYYHHCDAVQHNTPYCACVNKMSAHSKGNLSATFAECGTAISARKCPAVKMRKEELDAGKAIYFTSRMKIIEANEARDAEASEKMALSVEKDIKKDKLKSRSHKVAEVETFAVGTPTPRTEYKPKPATPAPKAETLDFSSAMAKVISDEVAKASETAKVVVEVATAPKQPDPAPAGKKSMIELAREMAAKRKAEAQA